MASRSSSFEPEFIEPVGWEQLFRDGWRSTYFLENVRITNDTAIFDGGFCDHCKWPIGNRTKDRLKVEWGSWAHGIRSFAAVAHHTMRIPTASERLLNVFTARERESFEARPVEIVPSPESASMSLSRDNSFPRSPANRSNPKAGIVASAVGGM